LRPNGLTNRERPARSGGRRRGGEGQMAMEEGGRPLPGEGAGDRIVARRPSIGEEAVVRARVEVELDRPMLGAEHGLERVDLR